MSNNIVLKHGLDIPIAGAADRKTIRSVEPDIIALKPTDFRGLVPRLLVREGDKVLAGSPVLADKEHPDVLFTSPVSGTVQEIVRGEKRKLLEVRIKADAQNEYFDFGKKNLSEISTEEVKEVLLKSGLWAGFIQRPYGVVADPSISPRGIFVSAFSTAPSAPDFEYVFGEDIENIQTGINAVARLCNGGIDFCVNSESSVFSKIQNVRKWVVTGKHPAGNVGIQISHIAPIKKGETVWTISLLMLVAIGRLFNTGKYDVRRKVAITGPKAINPAYVDALPGISMKDLKGSYDNAGGDIRFVSGDALTGKNVGENGYLGFHDNQVTLLHEGTERELLGWIKPLRLNQFSSSRAYFSWLAPKKKYAIDTNTHGGVRTFMMSDVYNKVLPMDIFPIYLVKACITKNIDDMEKYGIYEVLPEDLALCEFVDPSKNDIQNIISEGIDLMRKEMA